MASSISGAVFCVWRSPTPSNRHSIDQRLLSDRNTARIKFWVTKCHFTRSTSLETPVQKREDQYCVSERYCRAIPPPEAFVGRQRSPKQGYRRTRRILVKGSKLSLWRLCGNIAFWALQRLFPKTQRVSNAFSGASSGGNRRGPCPRRHSSTGNHLTRRSKNFWKVLRMEKFSGETKVRPTFLDATESKHCVQNGLKSLSLPDNSVVLTTQSALDLTFDLNFVQKFWKDFDGGRVKFLCLVIRNVKRTHSLVFHRWQMSSKSV